MYGEEIRNLEHVQAGTPIWFFYLAIFVLDGNYYLRDPFFFLDFPFLERIYELYIIKRM